MKKIFFTNGGLTSMKTQLARLHAGCEGAPRYRVLGNVANRVPYNLHVANTYGAG